MCDCEKKYALLIDAENISLKYIDKIMNECSKRGDIIIRNAYGSIDEPCIAAMKSGLLEHAIRPVQQFNYVNGKNSSDIRMAVDAMKILHDSDVDGFILVSADSDFTSVAMELREQGKIVIGFGKKSTPMPFRKACKEFIYIDLDEKNTEKVQSNDENVVDIPDIAPSEKELKQFIRKMLSESDSDKGLMRASELGTLIRRKCPDFDPRIYRCKTLTILLEKLGFEIKSVPDKNNRTKGAKIVYVKIK